jgi:hypothetical protein
MKLRYKWTFALVVILVLIAVFLFLPLREEFRESVLKHFQIPERESRNESLTTTTTYKQEFNQTNESNYPEEQPTIPSGAPTGKEAERALTLELIDICSGKLDLFTVSEGATNCLNKKPPYYVVLEKNSTHLKVSLQNESFEEVYELNSTSPILFIFAEDVASVSHEIESFTIEGSTEFHLGEYYLHTIWEKDASGNLAISKMIVALSLYVDSDIAPSNEWKELKFYLKIPDKTYYLGNLFVLVK